MLTDAQNRVIRAYKEVDAISRMQPRIQYIYGGGHNAQFINDPGYDCSGFISHVLHVAGILAIPHATFPFNTQAFESWGGAGEGQWLTVWDIDLSAPRVPQHHCFLEFHIANEHNYPNTFAQAAHEGLPVGWMGSDIRGFNPRHWPGS
jgi:hypothetical protein